MNKDFIKSELSNYGDGIVTVYLSYLSKLETEKKQDKTFKNYWFKSIKEQQFVDLFKKVAIDKLYIDGETITLQYRGALTVFYGFQAYRTLLLLKHPESTIDLELVFKGDEFSFKKDSGRVIYTHNIKNPFEKNKEIIGSYCIIKNSIGENIEILNMDDVAKMRNAAKTDVVWKLWLSEMIKKSNLKRACKRYFYDTFKNMESLDNENYDLTTVEYDSTVKASVEAVEKVEDLTKLYNKEINLVKDKNSFIDDLSRRKNELITEEFKAGTPIEKLQKKYDLTDAYCKEISND